MAEKVLLVDDDEGVRRLLRALLEEAGYAVSEAADGHAALAEARRRPVDLFLLDLGLPGLGGREVCRLIRRDPALAEAGVLVLTADKSEGQSVACLEGGADDFVAKPFAPSDVLARVRAVLRRRGPAAVSAQGIERAGLRLDGGTRSVQAGEKRIGPLTPTEFALMAALLRRSPAVVPRLVLSRELKGVSRGRALDVHLRRLRAKLGRALARRLVTVPGEGHQFV